YLDHLTSCSLDSLKNEPANLTREASRLQQQLADLAYTEYGSFLRANECTRAIRDTFTGLETRLNSLTKTLPELEAACTSFAASSAQEVLKDRRREHIVLNQHAKLVEILEIPQLMDTLIRNGYYDEAMDLQTHVQRLLLRYPQYKLLRSVASELDAATKVMLTQLVNLLKGDVKLPLCIRVMGYLRRMEAVPEPELRLIFLQQRDKFFKKRVEEACGNDRTTSDVARDHVEYVRKYIDVCRECFFDIVAQYRAIFSDATAPGTASRPNPASSASTSTLIYDTASHTTLTHSILSSYVIHRIQHLNATLQAHLPYINDASQVASLCTQTMYFGMSLSRVGIDFRAVISHVFEDAVEEIVRKVVEDGAQQFVATSTPTTPNPSRAAQSQVVQAPITLLAHPSIAHLLNAFYTAYNHLRALPSLALHHRVQSIVETNLTLCTNVLADAIATWWDSWSHSERSIVVLVTNAWSNVLVP
ncbi:Dor1-like family-domain-containing protein, partial [Powellomyces hirtus]